MHQVYVGLRLSLYKMCFLTIDSFSKCEDYGVFILVLAIFFVRKLTTLIVIYVSSAKVTVCARIIKNMV